FAAGTVGALQAGLPRRAAGRQGGRTDILRPGDRRLRPLSRGQPRARQAPAPGAVASPASGAGVWGGGRRVGDSWEPGRNALHRTRRGTALAHAPAPGGGPIVSPAGLVSCRAVGRSPS